MKKSIEVCLSPELIHQHELKGKIIVVVDIFRATSCVVTGLSFGIKSITPVSTIEECLALGQQGLIMAGERGGKKIDEFNIGNSPFEYQNPDFINMEVAITTTNGTLAIERSNGADQIVIGSFLNLSATADFLQKAGEPVVIHCAGWKGTPNIEDTLYAGALINEMGFDQKGDSSKLSHSLYLQHKHDLLEIASQSGHAKRLAGYGVTKDIEFCLQIDKLKDIIVVLQDNKLVKI